MNAKRRADRRLDTVSDFLQVSTTTDSRETAMALATSAVQARLAAGAQITGPAISVYWHEGEFGTGEEWQLLLKTTADRYPDLEAHLLANHPWQNPEVTAVPLVAGSDQYLTWVRETVVHEPSEL